MTPGTRTMLLAALLALAAGTAFAQQDEAVPPDAVVPPPEPFTACEPDNRPQVCNQHYQPVCGAVDTGIRCVTTPCESTEWRTYPNGCAACTEADVSGWRDGACPGG